MAHTENLSGHTLAGNYLLKEKKGTGQISDIYLAWDKKRTAEVAVKLLRRERSEDREIKGYFSSEAKMMAALDHPHIVRFYEFCDEGRFAFFVMDWVEGIDLKAALQARQEPYELDEVCDILKPISSALNYAHSQKIIHCDIKPANILVEISGKVLLTDFGIARHASQQNAGGTPPYMAPEQFENGKLTPQTDIYALGVTIYELLSGGQVPYRGDTQGKQSPTPTTLRDRIYWEVMNLPYPGLNQFNKGVPLEVEKVVKTALQKNPLLRYASALEFNQAFDKASGGKSSSAPKTSLIKARLTLQSTTPFESLKLPGQPQMESAFPSPPLPSFVVRRLPERFRGPFLACVSGQFVSSILLLTQNFVSIGRSSQNTIVLSDRSISRKHASLQINRQGVFLRDEGSTLGTYVNGQPVQNYRLMPRDIIQIGYADQFEFQVR